MKKFTVIFLFFACVLGLVAGFILLNSKPDKLSEKDRQEALSQILGRKPNLNPEEKTGETTFNGKYVVINYPAKAKIYEYVSEGMKNDESLLETFSFDIEPPRIVFNYTAYGNNPFISSITDIPAVALRQNKLNGYSQKEVIVDGQNGLTFSKQGSGQNPSEVSTFFYKDNVIISFSVSGNDMKTIEKISDEVLKTTIFNF